MNITSVFAKGRGLSPIVNENQSIKQIKIASGRAAGAQSYSQSGVARRGRGTSGKRAQCVGASRRRHGQPALRLT